MYDVAERGRGGGKKVGLTRQEIIKKFFDVYGRPLPDWQLRQEILPALESAGLVYEDIDPDYRRRKLVYLVSPPEEYGEYEGGGISEDEILQTKFSTNAPPSNSLYHTVNPPSKVTEAPTFLQLLSEQGSNEQPNLPTVTMRFGNGATQEVPLHQAFVLAREGKADYASPTLVTEQVAKAL
jgi:hypothetical protein